MSFAWSFKSDCIDYSWKTNETVTIPINKYAKNQYWKCEGILRNDMMFMSKTRLFANYSYQSDDNYKYRNWEEKLNTRTKAKTVSPFMNMCIVNFQRCLKRSKYTNK